MLKAPLGVSTAALVMVIIMLPFFLLAMYERNGQPAEKVLKNIINVMFLRPKQRPYKTNNFYSALERQARLDKEVSRIVCKNQPKADSRRTAADRGRHSAGKTDKPDKKR